MPAYDLNYHPPAPVADVTHGQLGLTPKGLLWIRGYDGTYTKRPVYYAQMTIEGFMLTAVRCIAAARNDALLGRNVLNHFSITLHGKQQVFELSE